MFVNDNYHMIHIRIPRCSLKTKRSRRGLFVAWPRSKNNATPNSAISRQREKVFCAENTVAFLSFGHFLTFSFRESEQNGLLKLMKWFAEVMERKNVFPKGEDQHFLKA